MRESCNKIINNIKNFKIISLIFIASIIFGFYICNRLTSVERDINSLRGRGEIISYGKCSKYDKKIPDYSDFKQLNSNPNPIESDPLGVNFYSNKHLINGEWSWVDLNNPIESSGNNYILSKDLFPMRHILVEIIINADNQPSSDWTFHFGIHKEYDIVAGSGSRLKEPVSMHLNNQIETHPFLNNTIILPELIPLCVEYKVDDKKNPTKYVGTIFRGTCDNVDNHEIIVSYSETFNRNNIFTNRNDGLADIKYNIKNNIPMRFSIKWEGAEAKDKCFIRIKKIIYGTNCNKN